MNCRRFLSYALTVSLVSTGTLPAWAHEGPPAPVIDSLEYQKQIADADDYNRSFADLEQAGLGQPKSSLAPDRFLLMMQSVYPKEIPVVKTFVGHTFRRWKFNALRGKTQTYMNILAAPDAVSQPNSEVMTPNQIRTAILAHLKNGRRTDTPLFLWERRQDQAQLKTIFAVLRDMETGWKRTDDAGLSNVTDAPMKTQVRSVNWWDLQVQIQKGDQVVQTLRMADTSTGQDISRAPGVSCEGSETCRFNLVRGNTLLHVYGVPSTVIGTFEQFIVFADRANYDAETGIQYVSFLDLGSYNALLGNEDIPVFRMPLKIDRPIESLKVVDGKLVVNGSVPYSKNLFEKASDMQQVVFNLQANLVSPDTWPKVLPLVDSLQEYFKKVVDSQLEEAADNQDAGETRQLLTTLGQELQRHLDTVKTMKPLPAKEVDKLAKHVKEAEREAIVQENTPHARRVQESADLLNLYHQRVKESSALTEVIQKTQARVGVSRKFSARARLLVASLLSPRPFMSQKIKEALGIWYVQRPSAAKTPWSERLLRLSDSPYVNAGVIAAAITALAAPSSFHLLISHALSLSTGVLDYTFTTFMGLGEATVKGSETVAAMVQHPIENIDKQYIANHNWARTLIGTGALLTTLSTLYFVPHFIFNLAALRKDMKALSVRAFIDRQNNFRKQYFARLAAEEGESRGLGENVQFSAEEEAEIQNFLQTRQAEIDQRVNVRGTLGKVLGALNPVPLLLKAKAKLKGWLGYKDKNQDPEELVASSMEDKANEIVQATEEAGKSLAVQKAETDSPEDFKSFWGALKHFAFSRPAFELTLQRWASIWNSWAAWRFTTVGFGYVRILGSDIPLYLKLKPVTFTARLVYPEFFNTVVFRRGGRAVLPTQLNGGLRRDMVPRCTRAVSTFCHAMTFTSAPELESTRAQLKALEAFEDQIIEVEDQVVDVAFRASLENLAKYMQNPEDLKKIFGSTPISSITRKEIKDLSWGSRTFLRAYFESVFDQAMAGFLREHLNEVEDSSEPGAAKSLEMAEATENTEASDFDPAQENTHRALMALKREVQALKVNTPNDLNYNFKPQAAKDFALRIAQDPTHYRNALAAVERGSVSAQNFNMNVRYDLVSDIDPAQNPSMKRVDVVRQRLESPSAVGRAVRAELSKLMLTFPIDITTKFFLSAGIFVGQLKPIQEAMFGPNSTFYLSHTSFYMMMASGVFMGMMADAWIKLQMDARQDDAGEFKNIPKGEDAERSFLSWYRKQYSAPQNSIMKQWSYSNYVSFWNLPAALTNIGLFYFMFSGRFDVSLLVAGYAITFLTPLSAFTLKVDQAFERAALFPARGIKDEKWLAHPQVQEMLTAETQRLRNRFTIWKDILANVEVNAIGAIEMVPTSLGPRGFQRALMGGGLAEEYIVNYAIEPLQKLVSGVPGLNQVVTPLLHGCESLLTHGNTDLRLHR